MQHRKNAVDSSQSKWRRLPSFGQTNDGVESLDVRQVQAGLHRWVVMEAQALHVEFSC